jgi:hypothetical protein
VTLIRNLAASFSLQAAVVRSGALNRVIRAMDNFPDVASLQVRAAWARL